MDDHIGSVRMDQPYDMSKAAFYWFCSCLVVIFRNDRMDCQARPILITKHAQNDFTVESEKLLYIYGVSQITIDIYPTTFNTVLLTKV